MQGYHSPKENLEDIRRYHESGWKGEPERSHMNVYSTPKYATH